MKCYYASFNVGNVEVWGSDLFLQKKWVIIDVEESIGEIVERISDFSYLEETKIIEAINQAIIRFKQARDYREKENDFDFFILEQHVWKDIQEREMFTQKIKIEDGND